MSEQERPLFEECTCTAHFETNCKYQILYSGKKPPFFYCNLQPKDRKAS